MPPQLSRPLTIEAATQYAMTVLEKMTQYRMPSPLDDHFEELAEEHSFQNIDPREHCLAIVKLTQELSILKLQAEIAVRDLRAALSAPPRSPE
jgi:hypothetical protein